VAAGLILTPRQLIKVLGNALRWIIGLSMLFELFVALVLRHPLLPVARVAGVDYHQKHLPVPFYWSRGLLFHGGQIQGIVGNGDLLAMVVLVGLIVFAIQRAEGLSRPFWGTFWIVLAGVELVLARSSTVWVATIATAVMLCFAMWARRVGQRGRGRVYLTGTLVIVATVGGILAAWDEFTALFNKTPTLTGRTDIWAQVIPLAQEHTWFGWGWLGYWVPWAKPFDGLAIRNGVEYLQAHNAWIDIWLQLGIVGVVVLALLAITTLGRAWFLAVDRPMTDATTSHAYSAIALLPLLVFTAQLVQSIAESRMLIESGFAMLVLWSVTTKAQRP
jgi:O-antigen ligase